MSSKSNYDKHPCLPVSSSAANCWVGWRRIIERLTPSSAESRCILAVECYPGTFEGIIKDALVEGLRPTGVIYTRNLLKAPHSVDKFLAAVLGDDPIFGRMNDIGLQEFFDESKLSHSLEKVTTWRTGLLLIVGVGAAIVSPLTDVLVYADLARWEIQGRQRRNEISNLGADNSEESPSLKYKRAFFVDWRAADRLKRELLPKADFFLDTNNSTPKLVAGDSVRAGLTTGARRPFRVVPYFDPGPWGGHWMEEVCNLPKDTVPNHAWCFDCVPEENSLLLGFGDERVEIPSINLVFTHPHELLGEAVHARFGTEFPIRFDFLDTMDGGNLSFQVHPLTEYIQGKFGMTYTQDESYYLLDAGNDACVFLGLKENVDREQMIEDLHRAQEGDFLFDADKYVNRWPARKHDH